MWFRQSVGRTPLVCVAERSAHVGAMRLLVAHKADPSVMARVCHCLTGFIVDMSCPFPYLGGQNTSAGGHGQKRSCDAFSADAQRERCEQARQRYQWNLPYS